MVVAHVHRLLGSQRRNERKGTSNDLAGELVRFFEELLNLALQHAQVTIQRNGREPDVKTALYLIATWLRVFQREWERQAWWERSAKSGMGEEAPATTASEPWAPSSSKASLDKVLPNLEPSISEAVAIAMDAACLGCKRQPDAQSWVATASGALLLVTDFLVVRSLSERASRDG